MISLTASKPWEPLFEYTQFVGSLEFNRDAVLEAAQIYPSVFVHIAHQLKGKPLFPNLTTIHLEGLDTSSPYLPLLISTRLKDVTLKLVLGIPFLELTVYVFLENLVSAAPGLQSLRLHNVKGMAHEMLNVVVNFKHLHTLEIICVTGVESFEQLRPLGTLAALEYLSLTVEHLSYTRSTQRISADRFLPSLRKLHIEAPSDVVSDFILFITSDHLESFTFCHVPTHVVDPPQFKPKTNKKLYRPSIIVDDTVKEKVDFLDKLSSRWPQQLKKVVITSSKGLEIDLRDVAHLRVLKSLAFNGPSIISVEETFGGPYSFRNSLQSLHLSRYRVSLSLLRKMALSIPFLREMTISIDILEQFTASSIPAITHPLQSLTVDEPRMSSSWSFSAPPAPIDLSQLIFMARYLNALFPSIQSLTASTRAIEWGKVWQLLQFCQASRDDEQGRKSIRESPDVN
jgi:hypothetical protein